MKAEKLGKFCRKQGVDGLENLLKVVLINKETEMTELNLDNLFVFLIQKMLSCNEMPT